MKNTSKIICIGWHKTGTSTIGDALLELGYDVIGARLDLSYDLMKNNYTHAIEVAKNHDALQDMPWAVLYRELDKAFPGSKFILTLRDEDKWLESAKKHFKDTYTDMRKWIYGNGVLEGNEELYIKRYREHYDGVSSYFNNRPDDMIVMDFKNGDGWEKLCKFLNKPIPKKSFPHTNKGKHNFSNREKLIYLVKKMSPRWLRVLRINILVGLGFPDKRNRFNNKINKNIIDKRNKN